MVVLDLMLPGDDGLTLCRNLRARSEMPVIMLTARGEETDRIVGLEMGADDYLAKPFNPRELLARIKSVLRRSRALPDNLQSETRKPDPLRRLVPRSGVAQSGVSRRRGGGVERHRVQAAAHLPRAPEPGAQPRPVDRPHALARRDARSTAASTCR